MSGKNLKIDGKVCPNVTVIKALDTDQNKLVEFVDTSDANATSSDIITGKTAYVDGKKVIGEATAGVDTNDATAVSGDILQGKTAYAKGVKLTGSIETYDGTFVPKVYWKASVSNLGAQDPNTVVFTTPEDSIPKPWSEVEFNGDVFIKFPKMYKKIVTVTDNQITAFEIANAKLDDDYKLYPCFIDESGNELDYILVGKYLSKSRDTCNSVETGSVVSYNTVSIARTKARARGTGYQLMDWRIHRLWQDLIICAMKTVNTNSGSGITTDIIGFEWRGGDYSYSQYIDGISKVASTWLYSNIPSKYIDNPTASSEGYVSISEYTVPIASDNKNIKKLGYDSTQPFFNYPSETVSNSWYDTYYCDACYCSNYDSVSPFISVGQQYSLTGVFYFYGGIGSTGIAGTIGARLCYRPISS